MNETLLPLLAIGAPIVVAIIKRMLPALPKKYVPLLAPLLGGVAEVLYRISLPDTMPIGETALPPGVLALAGASGVAVREVVDQWRKDGDYKALGAVLLPLGLAVGVAACTLTNVDGSPATAQQKTITGCTVAAETYRPVQESIEQALASPLLAGKEKTRTDLKLADKQATAALRDCADLAEQESPNSVSATILAINAAQRTALSVLASMVTNDDSSAAPAAVEGSK